MKLAKYKACICEGAAEHAIIDLLLDYNLLAGKKPSAFCKENLNMPDVKSYNYVYNYFSDVNQLIEAIKKYHSTSKIQRGEFTLLDLLK